jgi:hypothetical protein
MASETNIAGLPLASVEEKAQPISSRRFDWIMVVVSIWWLGGLFIDGWAHSNIPQLETFFTPWHGVLYSGFLLTASFLAITLVANHLRHRLAWRKALPSGYELSGVGAVVFLAGGVGDMLWHTQFGIERDDEALISPTHLLLGVGMVLIASGPIRAAWKRPVSGLAGWLPPVLALAYLLAMFQFFTFFANPFAATYAANAYRSRGQFSGSYGIYFMFETALIMGLIFLAMKRWTLPFGSLTLILTFAMTLITLVMDRRLSTGPLPLIITALVAGLLADGLVQWLKPGPERPAALRLFAIAIPVILFGLYFLTLQLFGGGIWWSVTAWVGILVQVGVVGLLMSYISVLKVEERS